MSTIAAPTRNANYLELQGYRKSVWAVTLHRYDTGKTYTPTQEAFNIPRIQSALESDRYSISIIPTLTVEFIRTPDFLTFIRGLTTPRYLEIVIQCYPLFLSTLSYKVWMGRLQNLPEGTDGYIGDSFRMKFIGNPGHWLDADDVKDSNTSTWYKDKHVTDTVIPALMAEAAEKVSGSYVVQAPDLKGDDYFWSAWERPYKKLADSSQDYDATCKCTALCWDSTNDLLYAGVHDEAGSETDGWILSFNPATRVWAKVTQIKYTGGKKELRRPTEWEIQHLEYSSGVVYGVARTNHANLLEKQAHFHCQFNFTVAATPAVVSLTDANLFTLHDKGQKIHSRPQSFSNLAGTSPISSGGVDYYMYADAQVIGWGPAAHDTKEAGVLHYTPDFAGAMPAGHTVYSGGKDWPVTKSNDKRYHPAVGYHLQIYDDTNNRFQYVGKILTVRDDPSQSYFIITVQHPAMNDYAEGAGAGVEIYLYFNRDSTVENPESESTVPEDNVFIAEPQQVEIEYDSPYGLGSVDPAPIRIDSLQYAAQVEQYYWPRKFGTVEEDEKFTIPHVGYASFVSMREPAVYEQDDPVTYYNYYAGDCAPFTVKLKGYNPAYLIADNFWVRSDLQDHALWYNAHRSCNRQAGKCQLIYNGTVCRVSDGRDLETYGDIFLWKDGSTIYAAWNDHGQDSKGRWFSQCKVARWTGSIFQKIWVSRSGDDWADTEERYITSFAVHNNEIYLGMKYYEPNWVDTQIEVLWGAPPQDTVRPTNYEGGLVALIAFKGDKTDVLEEGDLFRVGGYAVPGYKIYQISEVGTGERELAAGKEFSSTHLVNDVSSYTGALTWCVVYAVDKFKPGQYNTQIRREFGLDVGGHYLSLMKGRDERHQICRLDGTTLTTLYTATPDAGEPSEGQEVDWNEQEFQGESYTVEYDDDYLRSPRVELDNPNVVSGSITVKLKDSGRELDLTDYTDTYESAWYKNWPIPLGYQVFAHRQQGSDYQTCYLYFPPSLDGEAIDVQYEYYQNGAAIKWPVVYGGDLYFCETGPRHRWLKLSDSTFENTYSPRLGDYDLTVAVAGEDRIWAVGVPSYVLLQYYTKWTGHVTRVYGEDVPIWSILGGLARAGDQYCFQRNDVTYIVNRSTATQPQALSKILSVEKIDLDPYKRVILSYENGKVDYGSGKPELALSCPYVYDKGHAEILVKRGYDYYNSVNTLYRIRVAGVIDQYDLLQEVTFEYQANSAAGIVIGRELGRGITDFIVHEKVVSSESRV